MKYIIENITTAGEDETLSYLIELGKIRYVNQHVHRLLQTRLNIQPFQLSPGKIMHSYSFETASIQQLKQNISTYIQLGCTTVIAMCTLERANDLQKVVANLRHQLVNSAIDYCVGIRLSCDLLTPNLIRMCKREMIPMIHLQVATLEQLDTIAWEWIREALFYYRVVMMPEFSKDMAKKERLQAIVKWDWICETYQIPTTTKRFAEKEPYDRLSLQKIGLYPTKSILMVESDVDYYLSRFCEKTNIETVEVVVIRGRVIKAGERIFYSAGFGREVKIKLPGRFQELASSTMRV